MHFKYTTGADYISCFQTAVWEPTGLLKLVLWGVPCKRRTWIIKQKNWNNNKRLFWPNAIDRSLITDCLWRFFLCFLSSLRQNPLRLVICDWMCVYFGGFLDMTKSWVYLKHVSSYSHFYPIYSTVNRIRTVTAEAKSFHVTSLVHFVDTTNLTAQSTI